MSKSRGTPIAPDDLVEQHGADILRLHLMYLGPWDQGGPWNTRGMTGMERFVRRAIGLVAETATVISEPASEPGDATSRELRRLTHKTIKRVTEDLEDFQFNTMVAALIEFSNALGDLKSETLLRSEVWREAVQTLVALLAPSTPYVAEEMWSMLGQPYSVHHQQWPEFSPELARDEQIELIVQINGKLRDKLVVASDVSDETAKRLALSSEKVKEHLAGSEPLRVIYVPRKLVNLVVK